MGGLVLDENETGQGKARPNPLRGHDSYLALPSLVLPCLAWPCLALAKLGFALGLGLAFHEGRQGLAPFEEVEAWSLTKLGLAWHLPSLALPCLALGLSLVVRWG